MSGRSILNRGEYLDRLYGCWSGKNIGGTLGGPMEGKREFFNVDFYTQDLSGKPAPNDDLDLQLIWLLAVEEQGVYRLNERILAEYWMNCITAPWNEYGVAKTNIANGLFPPLSGAFNNEIWRNSNGAWIRSEIWAALFPGDPDEALKFAYCDACVDHSGEGIYAELFTAALESAAYIEQDIPSLIRIALSKIPENSLTAQCVDCAVRQHREGRSLKDARDAVLEHRGRFGHPGWDGYFQAPAHIGFVVLALLYGEGDFSKTVCAAVNCGDDTDCTAATAGAVMGILLGRSGIPEKWMKPIGETIETIAVKRYRTHIPETLSELVRRTAACRELIQMENPELLRIDDAETQISRSRKEKCAGSAEAETIWKKCDGKSVAFDFPWGRLTLTYEQGPVVEAFASQTITLHLFSRFYDSLPLQLEWMLPEGWEISPSGTQEMVLMSQLQSSLSVRLTAGAFRESAFEQIPVRLRIAGRKTPWYISIPFQCRGGAVCGHDDGFPGERKEFILRIDAWRNALQEKG